MTSLDLTNAIQTAQIEEWQTYIGRTSEEWQFLDRLSLRRFLAVLGDDDRIVQSVVPEMGHWAYFLPFTRNTEIGADGHIKRGGFLPPISLPRRMFASGNTLFLAPLYLDRDACCRTVIVDIKHKTGSSGDLLFVELERTISQDGSPCLVEHQTLVYRQAGSETPATQPSDPEREIGLVWSPGPVDLFRFSAVTFNGHRIHYDSDYARNEEGYPGLVVHGPFTASVLCRLIAREAAGRIFETFSFRAQAPLFANQPIRLQVFHDDQTVRASALRQDGAIAMVAEGRFRV